jgi:hypothetical protein
MKTAPKTCTQAPDEKDIVVNLDASNFRGAGAARYSRGPELFSQRYDEKIASLLKERAELDALAGHHVFPVIRITDYHAPKVDKTYASVGMFTGGDAKFDVAVIDLEKQTLLCRGAAEAKSSTTLKATTFTSQGSGGTTETVGVSAGAYADLAQNITRAALAAVDAMTSRSPRAR